MLTVNNWQTMLEWVAWNNLRDFLTARLVCKNSYKASKACTTAWVLMHATGLHPRAMIVPAQMNYGPGVWVPCIQQRVRYIDCSKLLKTVSLPQQLFENVLRVKMRRSQVALDRAVVNMTIAENDFAFTKRVVQTWGNELREAKKAMKRIERKSQKQRIGFANSKVKVLVNDRIR